MKNNNWIENEKQIMILKYSKTPISELEKLLPKRSRNNIYSMACMMDLRKDLPSSKIKVIDESEKKYILENHTKVTAENMAKHLNISKSTMYVMLRKLKLKAFDSTKKMTHLKSTIIKENYQKVGWKQLSEMVGFSVAYLKKYVELNFEQKSNEIKMKDYSFDDGNGNFDVNKFAKVWELKNY